MRDYKSNFTLGTDSSDFIKFQFKLVLSIKNHFKINFLIQKFNK